jgi:predicted DNA-binding transcriptional regulator AlpA
MSDDDRALLRNLVPRNLRADHAAAYVGVSPSKFRQLVKDGRMPASFQIDGCVVWDRFDLDAAVDKLKTAAVSVVNFFDAKIAATGAGQ